MFPFAFGREQIRVFVRISVRVSVRVWARTKTRLESGRLYVPDRVSFEIARIRDRGEGVGAEVDVGTEVRRRRPIVPSHCACPLDARSRPTGCAGERKEWEGVFFVALLVALCWQSSETVNRQSAVW